ncbi:MAG: hypothetical protein LBL83_04320 [Clostridiales bacterium]|jgi:hypothetical protein|nr:hypothetical protein [Clostridiales bacterium]
MKYRRKLFLSKNIYDLRPTDGTFASAMRDNVAFHARSCPEYRDILENFGFDINSVCGPALSRYRTALKWLGK